jgi:DNA mismatch repair protein MSH6
MSRRNSNGRSPLVNPQRQITSFFTKTPSSSPSLTKTNPKPNPNPIPNPITNPNPNPNPSPTLTTPSPLNPKKQHKPRLVIGASPTTTPPSSSHSHFIGKRIKVYWPLDDAWYEGVVKSFDAVTNKHRIRYDDDEEESIDISKEKIEWLQDNSSKKLKRLRRGSSPIRKMVIEDNEVEGSPKEEKEELNDDDDDSADEDWGKNAVLEDAADEEEDMELEEENEVVENSNGKSSSKVEPKKRKLGGAVKPEPMKKSKSGKEVNAAAVKHSPLEGQ